ncbi:MAG: MBL fold metallo-hydrolase [Prolixibacteraceae bacterium]|nr:MBL fold metallo-hydrolase [Prolixibacteraceae bacterium]
MKFPVRFILFILFIEIAFNGYPQDNDTWFKISEVGPKTWLLEDHGDDNIYLLEGDDKALIIDTGMGNADLLGAVRKITDKSLFVVNTHGHPDHSGTNYQFDKIYLHRDDVEAAKMFSGKKPNQNNQFIGEIFNPEFIPVSEGYKFDLGNRVIEVMETPGHTPGSICFLDVKNKFLFTGDNNNSLVWLFLDGCLPLSEYLKTLEMQVSRLDEFTTLYPGHGPAMSSEFIIDQVNCVKTILDGTCEPRPYESFVGEAKICSSGNASVAFNPENL